MNCFEGTGGLPADSHKDLDNPHTDRHLTAPGLPTISHRRYY